MKILKAGKTEVGSKRPTAFLPLELIVDHPEMGQRELDKDWVTELKESIRTKGLDTPLFVWTGDENSKQMEIAGKSHPSSFLVAGLHRRAALNKLRKEDREAFDKMFPQGIPVKKFDGSLKDMLLTQIRENVARLNPTAEQLLPQMMRLRDEFKMKGKHIARDIGKSEAFVSEVFAIEDELGEEGVKEVLKGGISAKHAMKAARRAKEARKSGKSVDKKALIAEAKESSRKQKESGRERDEKRISFKKAWNIYKSLPEMDDEVKLAILEKMCAYCSEETDKFPKELKVAASKKSAAEDEDEDDE